MAIALREYAMDTPFAILIADRNRNVREFLRRELAAEGYQAQTAGNAGEIAARLSSGPSVGLVILDGDIAGADCAAVVRTIRAMSRTLPVIVHVHGVEEAGAVLNERFTIFVKKSEDLTRLKAAVAEALHHFQTDGNAVRAFPGHAGSAGG
ncbi:MAG: response regulator [Desulfovibrionaceae bacterium]|nr:response regulator [Desulfovibrionaceae bacterium]MBF0513698.1 response regulator [Desulfovibrionaceae bacterium]